MLRRLPLFNSVISAFRAVVKDQPAQLSLQHGDFGLSYAELDRLSDGLAADLARNGAAPGALIGVAAANGPGPIVALLAILKAGCGYVPLPDYYPADRLRLMAADAGVPARPGTTGWRTRPTTPPPRKMTREWPRPCWRSRTSRASESTPG